MRVFSPSSTLKWKKCPQEYVWYKLGVQPRILGPINYGGMFGSAMSEAMYHIHSPHLAGIDPKLVARAYVESTVEQFTSYGVSLDTQKIADMLVLLDTTIPRYMEAVLPLFTARGWHVVEAEWTVPDSGDSRIDLLCLDAASKHIIIDAKWKQKVAKAEYEQQAIDSYQHDWKMKHYCYFTGLHYNETILDYYIMLGIAAPKFKLQIIPYSVSAHEMRQWEISAKQAWADMDDPLRPVVQAADHEDRYGLCSYHDLCFQYDGDFTDVGAMQYVQIERKPKG